MTTVNKKLAIFLGEDVHQRRAVGRFLQEDPKWRVAIADRKPWAYAFPAEGSETHQQDTAKMLTEVQVSAALNANLYVAVYPDSNDEGQLLRWYDVANENGAEVEVYNVREDGSVALRAVEAFKTFGEAYVPDSNLPKAVWLDVDGTAFTMFDDNGTPLRGPFEYHKVHLDTPLQHTIDVVKSLQQSGYKVVVMSGREESCKEATLQAFADQGIIPDDIFMRPVKSNIPDDKLKYELFMEKVAPKYNVHMAFDDRDKVVKMLRTVLKIPVFQVNYGAF